MTNKRKALVFALFTVIILTAITLTGRGHFYEVYPFKSGAGWGYDILKKGEVYIHQPFIPAVEGEVPFPNKKSAKKTGLLVVRKIKNRESPAVTKEELKSVIKDW